MSRPPEVYITNFNRNFTGVSATIAQLVPEQEQDLRLVGVPLPGCPDPISKAEALRLCKQVPEGRPFAIWHVRRNTEMWMGLWARNVLRRPIKLVFTSAKQRLHSALPRWLIAQMDAVIATTDLAAETVPNVYGVVPHGVDTKRFHPAEDRAAAWEALGYGGARGVACVGRIRHDKATDRFVDTMIEVLPRVPDLTALVIGWANPKFRAFEELQKAKVKKAGLSDRILFVGEIAGAKMPEVFRALSLLVPLPRYEGYGMTPLEAMASAVPFVATDTGYYKVFSAGGRAGHIVEAEDAAAHVIELMEDPARLEALSVEARVVACENHAIAGEAAGIAAVYEKLWAEYGG